MTYHNLHLPEGQVIRRREEECLGNVRWIDVAWSSILVLEESVVLILRRFKLTLNPVIHGLALFLVLFLVQPLSINKITYYILGLGYLNDCERDIPNSDSSPSFSDSSSFTVASKSRNCVT